MDRTAGEGAFVDADRSSVVAYYGGPPDPLAELVRRVQRSVTDRLGPAFVPRAPDEVHATVIGLENPVDPEPAGDRSRFDARPLARHLVRRFTDHPLEIQFGGFPATDRRPVSRGASRYARSLSVGPELVVLIGWPVRDGVGGAEPQPWLAEVRRGCEPLGVRHRYHVGTGVDDPDAHVVLGRVDGGPGPGWDPVQDAARRELAARPVRVPMRAADLGLVEYRDPALPRASTRHRPLLEMSPLEFDHS